MQHKKNIVNQSFYNEKYNSKQKDFSLHYKEHIQGVQFKS